MECDICKSTKNVDSLVSLYQTDDEKNLCSKCRKDLEDFMDAHLKATMSVFRENNILLSKRFKHKIDRLRTREIQINYAFEEQKITTETYFEDKK